MQEFTVTYMLGDAEVERLKAIQQAYKEKGYDNTIEALFNGLILAGCKYDIAAKLDFAEKNAAAIEKRATI